MASQRCQDFMQELFAAMARSDREALAGLMTRSIRWWFPPSGVERADRPRSVAALLGHVPQRPEVGRDNILKVVGSVATFYQELHYTIEHLLEDGDMVAAHVRARGVTAMGNEYENEYHFLFRVENGKLAEGWEFLDTAYIYARNS